MESDFNHSSDVFNLGHFLNLLWRWAWLVALIVLICGGLAFIISKIIPPVYQAKTTVMINDLPSSKNADYGSIQLSLQLSQTYSQMIARSPILDEVAKRLGLEKIDPDDVDVQSATNLQLINITVNAPDPVQAVMTANTIVIVFREQAQALQTNRFTEVKKSLQTQITETEGLLHSANVQLASAKLDSDIKLITTKVTNLQQTYITLLQNFEEVRLTESETVTSIVLIEPATPPEKPIWPNPFENVVIAMMSGLILAFGVVYIIGVTDKSLKSPEEFSEKFGVPVLGVITHYPSKSNQPNLKFSSHPKVSEAFRSLRTNIKQSKSNTTNAIQTILIVSPESDEGKTNIAVNLGIVFANNGQNVCLIDANLRKPGVHDLLHLPNELGLSKALMESKTKVSITEFMQSTQVQNLKVVTSGEIPENPSELLDSKRMTDFLSEIKTKSDIVIIDTPPALLVTDANILIPSSDGVLVVMRAGSIHYEQGQTLLKMLERMGANILGIVVNDLINFNFKSY